MAKKALKLSDDLGRHTDAIMYNLDRTFARLDKKIKERLGRKDKVGEYLSPPPEKKKKIKNADGELIDEINISFGMIKESVQGLRMALKSPYIELLDEVKDRIVRYNLHIVPLLNQEEPYIPPNMDMKAKLNIIAFFTNAFYELLKVEEYNEEIRDEKYENAAFDISGDIQALYDAGFGREVRKKIKMGDVDLNSEDEQDQDTSNDEEEEEEDDPEYV